MSWHATFVNEELDTYRDIGFIMMVLKYQNETKLCHFLENIIPNSIYMKFVDINVLLFVVIKCTHNFYYNIHIF